ncbi:unnamed protein product [Prunus armeniaca]|uniref:NADP-dependent oxidoreductase domain-containing protein n=1 Tax=Prunus armeniaca TaxID=36596 RepID=A0A6J5V9U2_PRUAR|nr:unnamed protein product [Prunus armeniaca]
MHWPVRLKKGSVSFAPENLVEPDIPCTWRAMETLYDSGKARAIGVSNFSTKKLSDLLDVARVPPAVVQVECHPSWQQAKLHSFCKSKGIHISDYPPLGSPGTTWIKGDVLQNPILHMVAEKLRKTPAQVALRWGLQMGHSALPKSTNEARIKENSDVFGWSIQEDLLAKLSEIEQARLVRGTNFVHDTFGPYRSVEELWDVRLDIYGLHDHHDPIKRCLIMLCTTSSSPRGLELGGRGGQEPKCKFQQQRLARARWGPRAWAGPKAGGARATARRRANVSMRKSIFFLFAATWRNLVLPISDFSSNPTA